MVRLYIAIFLVELILYFVYLFYFDSLYIIVPCCILSIMSSFGLRYELTKYDIKYKTLARGFKNKFFFTLFFCISYILDNYYKNLEAHKYKSEILFIFILYVMVDIVRGYLYEIVKSSYFKKLLTGLYYDILKIEKYLLFTVKSISKEKFDSYDDSVDNFYKMGVPVIYKAKSIFEIWSTYEIIKQRGDEEYRNIVDNRNNLEDNFHKFNDEDGKRKRNESLKHIKEAIIQYKNDKNQSLKQTIENNNDSRKEEKINEQEEIIEDKIENSKEEKDKINSERKASKEKIKRRNPANRQRRNKKPEDYDEDLKSDDSFNYNNTNTEISVESSTTIVPPSREENILGYEENYISYDKNLDYEGISEILQSVDINISEVYEENTPEDSYGTCEITVESLSNTFSKTEAEEIFRILTFNSKENMFYEDFKQNLRQINNERTNLYRNIQDFNKMLKMFGTTLIVLEAGIFLLALNFLLGLNMTLLASFTPFFVVFILPFFKRVYDSFYFIVFSHPYDTGDRIYFHGQNLVVKEINILSTTCEKWNGEKIIINNTFMKKSIIKNVRRSLSQSWKINLKLNKMVKSQFVELRQEIKAFVRTEHNRYIKVIIIIDKIENDNDMHVSLFIKHRNNWQNGYHMWSSHTKFMRRLLEILKEKNIKYIPLTQPLEVY